MEYFRASAVGELQCVREHVESSQLRNHAIILSNQSHLRKAKIVYKRSVMQPLKIIKWKSKKSMLNPIVTVNMHCLKYQNLSYLK